MAYTVYWEGGSSSRGDHRVHRKSYATKAQALKVAKRASRMTRGHVTVNRGHREVADCVRGACEVIS